MKTHTGRYLGIVDWGIGGLSVYRLLKERRPATPVLYFSDTGAEPYGRMRRKELAARLSRVVEWMAGHGAAHVAVACNAASTVLPDLDAPPVSLVGMIEPTVRGVVRLRPRHLAIIGGRRTVVSGIYRRQLASTGIDVRQRIAQPLSGMIELGDTGSSALQAECRRVVRPLAGASHLLLACTHYPAIAHLFTELMPGTTIVDPACFVLDALPAVDDLPSGGRDLFFTTGDPELMMHSARAAFGVGIGSAKRVAL